MNPILISDILNPILQSIKSSLNLLHIHHVVLKSRIILQLALLLVQTIIEIIQLVSRLTLIIYKRLQLFLKLFKVDFFHDLLEIEVLMWLFHKTVDKLVDHRPHFLAILLQTIFQLLFELAMQLVHKTSVFQILTITNIRCNIVHSLLIILAVLFLLD